VVDPPIDGYLRAALSRAEEAEAKYRSLVELVPSITYVEAVGTGRTYSIGPQLEWILGYTQEEWMGEANRWKRCIHPDDRDRVVDACETANRSGTPYHEVYRVMTKDGRVVWIRDDAELVRGAGGDPLCWPGVMTRIAEPTGTDA
jgi:PAS domain S-box-containing protein